MSIPASIRFALDQYEARLRARFGDRLRSIILFGSFARGDADEDSDVDVLVVVDGLSNAEIGVAAGEVAPVILATGLPLAPLPISSERLAKLRASERLFARTIDSEGLEL
jgi:predicted nucleotidyltransferase